MKRSSTVRYVALAALLLFLAKLLAESPPTGYLSRGAPNGLRFGQPAPSAKPAVPHLGPRGISYNPSPVFVAQFADPPKTPAAPSPTNSAPALVKTESAAVPNPGKAAAASAPRVHAETNALTYGSLVRFFQEKKPGNGEKNLSRLGGPQLSATEISSQPLGKNRAP